MGIFNSNAWFIIWESRYQFLSGLENTFILFICGVTLAFLFGCLLLLLLEFNKNVISMLILPFINLFRMVPYLLLVYLIYYGLPQINIQLSAWQSGLLSLFIYHGAYFAESLRGSRILLPNSSIEAAKAYGYTTTKMFFRIVLPQVLMRSRPLMGNQLIYCLKDTAFLCVITVKELTSIANEIQSFKYIPFQSFITVMIIYWVLCLFIERIINSFSVFGRERGIENG